MALAKTKAVLKSGKTWVIVGAAITSGATAAEYAGFPIAGPIAQGVTTVGKLLLEALGVVF